MDGEVAWDEYVDMYGGIYTEEEGGVLRRSRDGKYYDFVWEYHEEFWDSLPRWYFHPQYNGSVYSFEYTDEGLRIRRYELNEFPVAEFIYYPMQGPSPLEVTIENYSYDMDGEIVRIDCDWDGDEIVDEQLQGNPSEINHTFTEQGENTFILTLIDDDDGETEWAGTIIVE